MKTENIYKLVLFVALVATTFEACQKDSTTDPSVVTSDRDKFLGTWSSQSTGPIAGTLNFTMSITAGSSSASQIKIENFDAEGAGTFVLANISGSSVSIPENIVNGDTIQGSGVFNNNSTISLTYVVKDGQHTDNRTATAHK